MSFWCGRIGKCLPGRGCCRKEDPTRAIRCYRKIGFKEIGRRRQAKVIQGKSYDIIYMDILAEELTGGSSLPPLSPPE